MGLSTDDNNRQHYSEPGLESQEKQPDQSNQEREKFYSSLVEDLLNRGLVSKKLERKIDIADVKLINGRIETDAGIDFRRAFRIAIYMALAENNLLSFEDSKIKISTEIEEILYEIRWVFSENIANLLMHGLLGFNSELGGAFPHAYDDPEIAVEIKEAHEKALGEKRCVRCSYEISPGQVKIQTWQSDGWPSYETDIARAKLGKCEDSGLMHGNGLFGALRMGHMPEIDPETRVVTWLVKFSAMKKINEGVDQELLKKIIQGFESSFFTS